jgi:rod shape-determining protein MreC
VLLLSDLNSKIPVTVEPDGVLLILSGTGKNHAFIQYSKKDKDIQTQSIVHTSGTGGLFKAGIPVGKINDTLNDDDQKKVIFFSDFSQLKFVKIFSFMKSEAE